MPYCNECGSENPEGAKFCHSCGNQMAPGSRPEPGLYLVSPPPPIRRELIPVTSRISQTGIDKFLVHGEHIVYTTAAMVQVGEERMRAYVTNRRLLLYRKDGILITRDRLTEIDLKSIGRTTMTEHGVLMKEFTLEIDGMQLKGRRHDLLNLYRVLHTAKAVPVQ